MSLYKRVTNSEERRIVWESGEDQSALPPSLSPACTHDSVMGIVNFDRNLHQVRSMVNPEVLHFSPADASASSHTRYFTITNTGQFQSWGGGGGGAFNLKKKKTTLRKMSSRNLYLGTVRSEPLLIQCNPGSL